MFQNGLRGNARALTLFGVAAPFVAVLLATVLLREGSRGPKEDFVVAVEPSEKMAAHTNRLENETSPYLLQHAHNPVNWYPWGEEAITEARRSGKPIFLSIGYSACHWCHVMERESFENEAIAAVLSEHFISIKADREERPDLDEIYMNAVVAMTGSGGWPMSVFLTPELKPFYGGTYYPPEDRFGRPGFRNVLEGVASAWRDRRDEVLAAAEGLSGQMALRLGGTQGKAGDVGAALLEGATDRLRASFDAEDGGWDGAPKFPSSGSIAVLLREYGRNGNDALMRMAATTLDHMANGGMYDHLGGGFHRYSVDAEWLVPHFEKMLYDNAQLSQVYLEAFQLTGVAHYRRVAEEIFEYELRETQDALGGFHSTEDADSEGEEGTFYLWTKQEILEALGEEAGERFCAYYNVREGGNFRSHEPYHAGKNILHVTRSAAEVAEVAGITEEALDEDLAEGRAKLLALRARRVRPGLDDKVLTAWNGLMITALAQGAQVLDAPRYREAAVRAGQFLRDHMIRDGQLLRTHRHGESRLPGYLDDYVFTANAFVDLYEATFDPAWLAASGDLMEKAIEAFWDDEEGVFYYTGAQHKNLIVRTKPSYDGAEPSGNSVAALALLRLAKLLNKPDYHAKAQRLLEGQAGAMAQAPQGYLRMLCAVDFLVHPPREIALAGDPDSAGMQSLLRALHGAFLPNKVVALVNPNSGAGATADLAPLLSSKTMIGGKATAYVCRDYTCKLPVTGAEGLLAQLGVS